MAMERFEELEVIGSGGFGTVSRCIRLEDQTVVAIKKVNADEEHELARKSAIREARILAQLHHPHVVRLQEVFRTNDHLFFVFEFLPRNCLQLLAQHPRGLPPLEARKVMWQLLLAVDFLHSQKLVHRDIKPENILLSDEGVVKLCDFGFARPTGNAAGQQLSPYVATRWYRAPELLLQDSYGPGADVWAVGCVCVELTSGKPLFPGKSAMDQLWLISRGVGISDRQLSVLKGHPTFAGMKMPKEKDLWPLETRYSAFDRATLDFVKACLNPEPKSRPSCAKLLKHEYFDPVRNAMSAFTAAAAKAKEDAKASGLAQALDQQHTPQPQQPQKPSTAAPGRQSAQGAAGGAAAAGSLASPGSFKVQTPSSLGTGGLGVESHLMSSPGMKASPGLYSSPGQHTRSTPPGSALGYGGGSVLSSNNQGTPLINRLSAAGNSSLLGASPSTVTVVTSVGAAPVAVARQLGMNRAAQAQPAHAAGAGAAAAGGAGGAAAAAGHAAAKTAEAGTEAELTPANRNRIMAWLSSMPEDLLLPYAEGDAPHPLPASPAKASARPATAAPVRSSVGASVARPVTATPTRSSAMAALAAQAPAGATGRPVAQRPMTAGVARSLPVPPLTVAVPPTGPGAGASTGVIMAGTAAGVSHGGGISTTIAQPEPSPASPTILSAVAQMLQQGPAQAARAAGSGTGTTTVASSAGLSPLQGSPLTARQLQGGALVEDGESLEALLRNQYRMGRGGAVSAGGAAPAGAAAAAGLAHASGASLPEPTLEEEGESLERMLVTQRLAAHPRSPGAVTTSTSGGGGASVTYSGGGPALAATKAASRVAAYASDGGASSAGAAINAVYRTVSLEPPQPAVGVLSGGGAQPQLTLSARAYSAGPAIDFLEMLRAQRPAPGGAALKALGPNAVAGSQPQVRLMSAVGGARNGTSDGGAPPIGGAVGLLAARRVSHRLDKL